MTAVVRHTDLTNTTSALLTKVVVDVGQEYGFHSIQKTFITAECGPGAGQTRDATTAANGFLLAQFKGGLVKKVISAAVIKAQTKGTPTLTWDVFTYGSTDNSCNLGFRVDNSVAGISSLYLWDFGTSTSGTTTILANGDKVIVTVEIGNT